MWRVGASGSPMFPGHVSNCNARAVEFSQALQPTPPSSPSGTSCVSVCCFAAAVV